MSADFGGYSSGRGRRQAPYAWRQSGQALIYLVLVMALMVTAMFVTYDASRLVLAKIKAQNGADAAALAAVSLKVSVHNTRTLAYMAMTYEATLARLEVYQALAAFQDPALMTTHLQRAGVYLGRLQRLQSGLKGYDRWIQQQGPALVTQAARIAYQANTRGLNDPGVSSQVTVANQSILADPSDLRENQAGGSPAVGGIDYRGEGTGGNGDAGKSLVTVTPQFAPLSMRLLPYPRSHFPIPASAAAGPVESKTLAGSDPQQQPLALPQLLGQGISMPWYQARLMPVGDDPRNDAHVHPLH